MAYFQSTITARGIELLTQFLAEGQELPLTAAAVGNGVAKGEPNQVTALANPITADVNIGEKSFVKSNPSYLLIPVYISNQNRTEDVYIREVMLYGLDAEGAQFPFAYAWLEGADADNLLPATRLKSGESDTVHIHEIALLATDQINAAVRIEVSGGNWITAAQMEAYALKKPKEDGKAGQFLQWGESGAQWADLYLPESFDNLLAYPGCTRTLKKEGSTYTEQIKTQGGTLRAERVTTITEKDDITESYTFYAEDGATVSGKFTVQTTKDDEGNWQEEVTEGESA